MRDLDGVRAALDARVLAWIGEDGWRRDEARFDALARDVFALQFARCTPYRRFCLGRGRTPETIESWREIPAVPTGAFKELDLRSHPAERTVRTFRTSGTSSARRGALHLDTLALYEAALLASFQRFVLPELAAGAAPLPIRVLAPAPDEAPESSLSHMFGCVVDRLGGPGSGFDVKGGRLETGTLLAALAEAARRDTPVALCGTAFAFVHLLDAMAERDARLALPHGSRVMETGGFKGRARELGRARLSEQIERRLGVPAARIVNQYGMTELGSQFYDSVLAEPDAPRRKLAPPWTRVRILDPETGRELTNGAPGLVTIVDLANVPAVLALQTADLGRRVADGFEVIGRLAGAEARGCSIAADAMLGGAGS